MQNIFNGNGPFSQQTFWDVGKKSMVVIDDIKNYSIQFRWASSSLLFVLAYWDT